MVVSLLFISLLFLRYGTVLGTMMANLASELSGGQLAKMSMLIDFTGFEVKTRSADTFTTPCYILKTYLFLVIIYC